MVGRGADDTEFVTTGCRLSLVGPDWPALQPVKVRHAVIAATPTKRTRPSSLLRSLDTGSAGPAYRQPRVDARATSSGVKTTC